MNALYFNLLTLELPQHRTKLDLVKVFLHQALSK